MTADVKSEEPQMAKIEVLRETTKISEEPMKVSQENGNGVVKTTIVAEVTTAVADETAKIAEISAKIAEEVTKIAKEATNVVEGGSTEQVEEKNEEPKLENKEIDGSGSSPGVEKSLSFKEESNFLSDLKDHEKKALIDLKSKVEEAIIKNQFFSLTPTDDSVEKKEIEEKKDGENTETGEEKKENIEEKKPNAEEKKENVEEKKENEEPKITEQPKIGEKQQEQKEISAEEKQEQKDKSADEQQEPAKIKMTVREIKEISLWGVPIQPSKGLESTDVVLLKFLRARDFKVSEAFEMIRNTVQWREDMKMDSILEEDFGSDLASVSYMNGTDREGHPVCYNIYGVFEDKELYQKTFGTEEKRDQFLRWRFQVMEKGIRKLNFEPGGVCSILQITDLKNTPGPSKKELRLAMKQAVSLLQDNYPEFVARNIFVNVPFWYYAFNALLSPFLTQRTKSKFVFARPAKVTETLLKYIPAEDIPIQYGGFKRENDKEFSVKEGRISELMVKAGSTESVEIPSPEVGTTILWDLTVLGWDVNYKEEFVPMDESSYTIIIQKVKKMGSQEEPVRNSFRPNEPGKVMLTIENSTFKRKRVLFRYNVKPALSS